MLDWPIVVLIGMLQGTLEWLPISSSGQTTIVMVDFLHIDVELAITLGLAVHIGTALAVIIKFPGPLMRMTNPSKSQVAKNYWLVTIVSLLIAFPLLMFLEETFDSNLWTGASITIFVGLALILTGLLLSAKPRQVKRKISRGRTWDMIELGIAQGFAVLPGISRSGLTVSALLVRGYEKTSSLKYSFLLSVPVSVAASLYLFLFGNMAEIEFGLFLLAAVIALIFGYLTMDVLIRVSRRINFSKFCIFFGGIAVLVTLLIWTAG
jgi:undecaprenyl-diphosphatase